tara:strand:- start:2447 stop:3295 length:849 start_codon:yes stop_codon:yes gene_type:complete
LSKANWKLCFNYFQKLSFINLLAALLIINVGYFIKSLRWKNILSTLKIKLNILFLFKVFLIGGYLGIITPGKLGDFGRLYYIKEKGNWKKLLASLFVDRLNDFIVLIILGCIAILRLNNLFPNHFEITLNYRLTIIIIFLLIIGFVVLKKFKNFFSEFYDSLKISLSLKNNLYQIIITFASMGCLYGSFILISKDLDILIGPIDILLIAFITGILNLLPITILGIGVREATVIYLFNLYGVGYDISIAFSLIIFVIQIITFLPGAFCFYKNPISLDKNYLRK